MTQKYIYRITYQEGVYKMMDEGPAYCEISNEKDARNFLATVKEQAISFTRTPVQEDIQQWDPKTKSWSPDLEINPTQQWDFKDLKWVEFPSTTTPWWKTT